MTTTNNIAERYKARYESKDFETDYFVILAEQFGNEKHEIVNRIIDYFNVSNYETTKELSNHFVINREQANKIYDFINDNLDSFTENYNGNYVGYTSLYSVEFGEQEEQLAGIYNHKTKKEYSLLYLQKIFAKADYFVKGEYAYYIVGAGLHINLLKGKDILNEFLLTIK